MNKLAIVGMGPGDMSYLTLEALNTLKQSSTVYTRTVEHPTVDALIKEGVNFTGFDDIYEISETFDDVYAEIVNRIEDALQLNDVVYAVPGNPFVAEKTVELLTKKYPQSAIIYGVSFLDAIITKLSIDPVSGLSVVNALELPKMLTQSSNVLVCIQCYDRVVASELKIWLSKAYDDEKKVIIARAIGNQKIEQIETVSLFELDRFDKFDHLTSVVVLPEKEHTRHDFQSLVDTISVLRSDNGCPWDREQTHDSVKGNLLEEAYEVVESINTGDVYGIEEELGDVLLQVVFHSQMAAENGDFTIEDVVSGITEKMIYRHPHVFGTLDVNSSEEVLENWEKTKEKDRGHQMISDALIKYSRGLPAAFRAQKVAKKAIKSGFKFGTDQEQLDKLIEEVNELSVALASGKQEDIYEELGDVLYAAISFGARFKFAAEDVINDAVDKFVCRFKIMENNLMNSGKTLDKLALEELYSAWNQAKKSN